MTKEEMQKAVKAAHGRGENDGQRERRHEDCHRLAAFLYARDGESYDGLYYTLKCAVDEALRQTMVSKEAAHRMWTYEHEAFLRELQSALEWVDRRRE